MRLFAGGVAGDDPDVVRKMRLGTLNAGVLTSVGVAEIDKSVYALGVPLMYDSYEEVYWRPREDAAQARGQPRGEGLRRPQLGRRRAGSTSSPRSRWRCPTTCGSSSSSPGRATPRRSRSGARPASTRCRCPRPRSRPRSRPASSRRSARRRRSRSSRSTSTTAPNMTDLRWQLLLGRDAHQQGDLGEDPGRPPARRCSRPRARRGRGSRRRSASGEAKDIEAMKKRGLNVVPVSAAQKARVAEADREHLPADPRQDRAGRGLRRGAALPRRVPEAAAARRPAK